MYKLNPANVNNIFSKTVWDLWAFWRLVFRQMSCIKNVLWTTKPHLTFHGHENDHMVTEFFSFLGKLALFFVRARLGSDSACLTYSRWKRVYWTVNILVWAEFTRKTLHEVSLIRSVGIVLTTLLLVLKGNTQEKAKQRANMSEKSVKESVQTHSCLHLHACVLSHTLSIDSTSFDFKIKGQIHYRIIKSALEKRISILWD